MLPFTVSTTTDVASHNSSADIPAPSPVLPPTTIPFTPASSRNCVSVRSRELSIESSSENGVIMGGMTPPSCRISCGLESIASAPGHSDFHRIIGATGCQDLRNAFRNVIALCASPDRLVSPLHTKNYWRSPNIRLSGRWFYSLTQVPSKLTR